MATTPRRFALNAPTIAGDAANVSYALLSASGATLIARTGSGVVALDAGYRVVINYDLAWTPHGEILWYYQAVEIASEPFDVPQDAALLAALTSGALTVTLTQAVPADGGVVRLVRGDDYRASEGRALVWRLATTLDLTGASGAFDLLLGTGQSLLITPVALTITAVPGVGYDLTAELTATQTAALPAGTNRRYTVRLTLGNGHVMTAAEDRADVSDW